MKIFNKIFFSKNQLNIIFLYIVSCIFFISFVNIFLAEGRMFFAPFEWLLVLFGIGLTTFYFKKYINKRFLTKIYFSYNNIFLIYLSFLLIIFINLIMLAFIYFVIFILMDLIGTLSLVNFVGNPTNQIEWLNKDNNYFYFIYAVCLESLVIIGFAFFMNYFIKNDSFIYFIIFTICLYSLIYGNIWWFFSSEVSINDKTYLAIGNTFDLEWKNFQKDIYFWLLPWNQVGVIAKKTFWPDYYGHNLNLFNLQGLGFYYASYKYIYITPYLYIIFLYLTPLIYSKFRKNENKKLF